MQLSDLLSLGTLGTVQPANLVLDRQVIAQRYGFTPPPEYFAVMEHFGTGEFANGVMRVVVEDYLDQLTRTSIETAFGVLRDNRDNDPSRPAVFPGRPGLFPWGWGDTGVTFNWLVGSAASPLPVVASDEDFDYAAPARMDTIAYLYHLLTGDYPAINLRPRPLPVDPAAIRFEPRNRVPF